MINTMTRSFWGFIYMNNNKQMWLNGVLRAYLYAQWNGKKKTHNTIQYQRREIAWVEMVYSSWTEYLYNLFVWSIYTVDEGGPFGYCVWLKCHRAVPLPGLDLVYHNLITVFLLMFWNNIDINTREFSVDANNTSDFNDILRMQTRINDIRFFYIEIVW